MTDDDKLFKLLKSWAATNITEIEKGNPPDNENGANAFIALYIVLGFCERSMSFEARREMATAVDKMLGGVHV